MKAYGKKYIGGLCKYSCRCGEEAPRAHTKATEARALKRRARAEGKKAAATCE